MRLPSAVGRFWLPLILFVLAGAPATIRSHQPKSEYVSWGEPHRGLQLGLKVQNPELFAGEYLDVSIHLRGDSNSAGPVQKFLEWPENNTFYAVIKEVATGSTWRRDVSRSGMPFFPGGCENSAFLDLREFLEPRPESFSMVSPSGETIPPGNYVVTVLCEQKPDTHYAAKEDIDPETVWSGQAASGAVPLTITDGPALRERFPIWTEVEIYLRDGRQWLRLKPSSRRVVSAEVRRGYATGRRVSAWIRRPDDREYGGGALSGGLENRPGDEQSLWDRPITAAPGDTLELEYVAFETSEKTPHLWSPESGDFRILWKKSWEIPMP